MMEIHQCSTHPGHRTQARILNMKVSKLTPEAHLSHDHLFFCGNRHDDFHILHTSRTSRFDYTLVKQNCKDSKYKSLSILNYEDSRYRAHSVNYRKFSLWLRLREYRDEGRIVNRNRF